MIVWLCTMPVHGLVQDLVNRPVRGLERGMDEATDEPVLSGIVTDAQGARVAGVSVTAAATAPTARHATVTGTDGVYRFDSLPPGLYSLTFERPLFRTESRAGIVVREGERRTLDVALAVAPLAADPVEVVATTPVLGAGLDQRRVPTNVRTIDRDTLEDRRARTVGELLDRTAGSATINDGTGNPRQQTLRFRGFTASPLLGLPQGIAVYQNGVRVNEAFGDTVQFDLVPTFALDSVQVFPGSHPTFGLNALGGSLGLRLKNGLDFGGVHGEIDGGAFGRLTSVAEIGHRWRDIGLYAGASRERESGWRDESDSDLLHLVGDIALRTERLGLGATMTYANTDLNGNGPAPVDLLAVERAAVYTFPDNSTNELGLLQARFDATVSPTLGIQANAYARSLRRRTVNADTSDFERCRPDARPPDAPATTLCLGADGGPLIDRRTGAFVTGALGEGDGAINRTDTDAAGYGASAQTTITASLGERPNVLLVGGSLDAADVDFANATEIGSLTRDRTVTPSGVLVGVYDEFPEDELGTDLAARNRHAALYFSDTLSLTPRWGLALAGRYTDSRIEIVDRLGTALSGTHGFGRFNPSIGVTVQLGEATTGYTTYNESSRAPTAAELSCADPEEPCRVPNAFLSDPPLEQVVARTLEVGTRGRISMAGANSMRWSTAWYRSRIADDIIFVASPALVGAGFFQNAGTTQRWGLELDLSGRHGRSDWYASYGLTRATFESVVHLPADSEVNGFATEENELVVEPGDRLPGIPTHGLKLGIAHQVATAWRVAVEAIAASNRVLLGDEGNDHAPIPGYVLLNLRSSYRLGAHVDVVLTVDNLLDTEYATFGVLAEVDLDLPQIAGEPRARFVTPGPPRGTWVGLRVRF